MKQKLDFSAAWNDVIVMVKSHGGLILPIAGLFIILPQILMAIMAPQPDFAGVEDPRVMLSMLSEYLSASAPWLIGASVVAILGNLAIYHLILGGDNPTVGQALSMAAVSFLPLFLTSLIGNIAVIIGLFLLLAPGIYLAVKFMLAGPVIAAEGVKNPIAALSRSWALTKGNSLRIFAFMLIIVVVGYVAAAIGGIILGGILSLISPALATGVEAFLGGLLSIVILFAVMAIYRQLAAN